MKRLSVGLLKLLGILLVPALIIGGTFYWSFIGYIPKANFPDPQSVTEAQAQDIAWLRKYPDLDRSFSKAEKISFSDHMDLMEDLAGNMTPAAFELHVATAVALSNNGHTNVSSIGRSRRMNRLPIRFAWFEEGLFVTQATDEFADTLGQQVLAIGGTPVEAVYQAFRPTTGGVEAWRRLMSTLAMNSPDLLAAAGIAPSADEVVVTFADTGPRTFNSLPANSKRSTPYGRTLIEHLAPEADRQDWRSLMGEIKPPTYLNNQGDPYVRQYLEDDEAYYIRLNYNYSRKGWDMATWLKDAEAEMREIGPKYVILDLRFNSGGTDITNGLAAAMPELVPADGLLFIVTAAETFSAGVGAAAIFKKSMGDRAMIVGTAAGDHLRFLANGGSPFRLPNSKISIPVWRALEDYKDGCWSLTKCFWLSPGFRTKGVPTIQPDLQVPLSFEAYRNSRDPSMDAIRAEIERRKL
jgi:hypothetical protein